MPVSWGGMRGIGSITIRIHNPDKPREREREAQTNGQRGKCSATEKMKMQVGMYTWGGGRGVRWTRTWWMQETPLSPPYTWGCVGNGKHRDVSHPNFIAPLPCQGGATGTARRVYMCPRVFIHLLRLSGRRQGMAHGVARGRVGGDIILRLTGPKIPTFWSKWPGQGLKHCCYVALYFTSHMIPWISWTQAWYLKDILFLQWKLYFLSQKCYVCKPALCKTSWNAQDNPRLDRERIHWCDFRMDGTLKLMSFVQKKCIYHESSILRVTCDSQNA